MRSWRQDHLSIHCWHYVVFLHYAENQPLVHSPLSLQKLFYEPLPLHLTSCICHTDSCRFWLVPPCLTKQLLLRPSHTSNCMHCVLPVCQLPQILPWPHLSCAVGDHFACVGNNAQSDSFPCYDDNFQMVDNFLFYWYVPCHRVAVQLVLHLLASPHTTKGIFLIQDEGKANTHLQGEWAACRDEHQCKAILPLRGLSLQQ